MNRSQREARTLRLNAQTITNEFHPDPRIAAAYIDNQSRIASLKAVRTAIKKLEVLADRGVYESKHLEDLRVRRDELVAQITENDGDPEE